jgi:hypothetical protein
VFTKVPAIIDAFERGVTIRPKGGRKFLAIPTGFNRQGGRRGAKPRVTPAQMVASGQGFLRPFKSGRGFVWCLPVRQGQRTGRGRGDPYSVARHRLPGRPSALHPGRRADRPEVRPHPSRAMP